MASPQFPSTLINKGPAWGGFESLKYIVVFGASYCDVGYSYGHSSVPTYDQPLGIEFPGKTYTEPREANWVGHLVTNYAANANQFLVYDYAIGGSQAVDVKFQIESMFKKDIGDKPTSAPWTEENALFITWVGINDSAWCSDNSENLKTLFEGQEILYNSGARNFLFVNVPPIDRSPARGNALNYINWNSELNTAAMLFAGAHPDATVMIYSSWDTFNTLLDDPQAHGFPVEDVRKAAASIWVDSLHPTSRVHDLVARDMSDFLRRTL